jgi:hypothetical protein
MKQGIGFLLPHEVFHRLVAIDRYSTAIPRDNLMAQLLEVPGQRQPNGPVRSSNDGFHRVCRAQSA